MSIDFLFADFDRLIQSAESVHRLRRFILDLAVRGKLVPQDPNDEPASELLKRMSAEKARLVKAKQMRKQGPFLPPDASEMSFNLPGSWAWCPSTFPSYVVSDKGKKIQTKDVVETGKFPVVDQGKVPIRGFHNDAKKAIRVKEPIVLFGDHTREVKLIDFDFVVGADGVKLLQPVSLHTAYYFLALQWLPLKSRGYGRHFKLLNASFIPLPPLAEQRRIVAKVDELMALCDRLEAARAEREATRGRLTAASLARLSAPDPDPVAFQHDVACALKNLPPLTTLPDQIKALRQTILNLAIRGKLVPQDPNDEPASEILKRIAAKNRANVVKDQERRYLSGIGNDDDVPYDIPAIWEWSSVGQLASNMRYGTSKKCDYRIKGTPVLRIPNVSGGEVELTDLKFGALTEEERKVLLLRENDLLIVRSNGSLGIVGRAAIVPKAAKKMSFAGYLVRLRFSQYNIQARYVWLVINSQHARNLIEKPIRSTVGLKNVNSTELAALTVPLPPLAEQRRIVAKVDELMALCDRLEASLVTGDETQGQLLQTMLHDALKSGGEVASY